MNVESKIWVQTLALKPGDLVLVKIDAPRAMPHDSLLVYFNKIKQTLRDGLDEAGHKDTQVLVCGSNVDISVIPAVDLLGTLSSGVSADLDDEA